MTIELTFVTLRHGFKKVGISDIPEVMSITDSSRVISTDIALDVKVSIAVLVLYAKVALRAAIAMCCNSRH